VNRDVRVVYAGTRQSYGKPDIVPVVENLLLKPVDVNGVNKMAGEMVSHGLSHGLRDPNDLASAV
jgi:UDP-glucose 4-epimerase